MAAECKPAILAPPPPEECDAILPAGSTVAEAVIRRLDGTGYSLLEISLVVPSQEVDELLADMLTDPEMSLAEFVRLLGEQGSRQPN